MAILVLNNDHPTTMHQADWNSDVRIGIISARITFLKTMMCSAPYVPAAYALVFKFHSKDKNRQI